MDTHRKYLCKEKLLKMDYWKFFAFSTVRFILKKLLLLIFFSWTFRQILTRNVSLGLELQSQNVRSVIVSNKKKLRNNRSILI